MILTVGAPYVGPLTFSCHDDHIARVMQRTHMVYEADLLRYMADTLPHDGFFIDVGAYIGTHSVYLAKLGMHGLAFEPWPASHQLCLRNLINNHVSDQVRLICCALGATDTMVEMENPCPHNTGMVRVHHASAIAYTVMVPFDHIMERSIYPLTMMKVDVEGYELQVLQGAQDTLKRWQPRLFVEAIGPQVQAVDAFLAPLGYKRQPGQWGYTPVYHWSCTTESSR